MKEAKVIGALIGLAGACNSNPKTKNTDNIIIQALANKNYDVVHLEALLQEIHVEKLHISPDCATCPMPCGNTSDYDMDLILKEDNENNSIKQRIILNLQALAGKYYLDGKNMDPQIFYKALVYLGFDLETQTLLDLENEISLLFIENKA